jgi:hypothetical protein
MAREDSFFDDLARGLADGSLTRGKALRLMGAAVVGGTLGSLGIGGVAEADNECKPTGKKCNKNAQCCSGICRGTCQAQTTTTTPTTSTSTSTTSTSTSTTSTSTTTDMCIPSGSDPGNACTADTQCCSDICYSPPFAASGLCNDCHIRGNFCKRNHECCSGLICDDGICNTCHSAGELCTDGVPCCGSPYLICGGTGRCITA